MEKENMIRYIDQIDQDKDRYLYANTPLDTIKMEGFVRIQNGDACIKAKNKFVQTTLQHITNMIAGYGWATSANAIYGPIRNYSMYIGSDTNTPTEYNTTALTTPIGTNPGTVPTTINGGVSNPSNGVFNMVITATWNPGTVSGTVGEMALYLNMYPTGNLRAFQWATSYISPSAIMASRLSAADGNFSAFPINTSNPLSIAWTIQLTFA
jgi:hypothetical protein